MILRAEKAGNATKTLGLVPRLDDPIVASEVFCTVYNFTVIAAAYSRRAESESASFVGYGLRWASTACSGRRCAGGVWLG